MGGPWAFAQCEFVIVSCGQRIVLCRISHGSVGGDMKWYGRCCCCMVGRFFKPGYSDNYLGLLMAGEFIFVTMALGSWAVN